MKKLFAAAFSELTRRQPLPLGVAVVAALLVGTVAGALAQQCTHQVHTHVEGHTFRIDYTTGFSCEDLRFDRLNGYDVVRLEDAGLLRSAGLPALPVKVVWIALPQGMEVTGLEITHTDEEALGGTYSILPAQAPKAIGETAGPHRTRRPDTRAYASSDFYPVRWAEFLRQADLAGQNLAAVCVHPVRYRPSDGRLTVARSLKIVIHGRPGRVCGDYLPGRLSEASRHAYQTSLRAMVVNPDDVMLESALCPQILGVVPGQCDYVIITTTNWADDFKPLADWRTKQGRPAAIVTTDWIYNEGGYGGTDLEKIRAFIIDAHTTWGSTDFLLGGDTHLIPYDSDTVTVPGYTTDVIDNDTYYADYDDDWVCEVNVGRASTRTVGKIATFIAKVLTYEKTPPQPGYATTAAFLGFDITTCGDMDGENFKENYVRSMYLPPTWSLVTEYDSEPGTHRADVLGYLDAGYHLVNHHDHCNTNSMGTGWICHGDLTYTSDIDSLTNAGRQSIMFAVGCYPAHVPTFRCIGEAALLNPNGGCVAFMGNTGIGWGGPPEEPDLYSLGQDLGFYRNLFGLGIYRLGENFTRLKNDEYDPYDPYNLHQYSFLQLHLLGDPGLAIWTDEPRTLTVSHPAGVPVGVATDFTVEVSDAGSPLDSATVCLWKEGDVYEVGHTSAGTADFAFAAASEGTLSVTVTKHNGLPYEGEATVSAAASAGPAGRDGIVAASLTSVVPNPFSRTTTISYAVPSGRQASDVSVCIYDCLGRSVRTLVDRSLAPGTYAVTWDARDDKASEVASGIYYCQLVCAESRVTRRIVLLR